MKWDDVTEGQIDEWDTDEYIFYRIAHPDENSHEIKSYLMTENSHIHLTLDEIHEAYSQYAAQHPVLCWLDADDSRATEGTGVYYDGIAACSEIDDLPFWTDFEKGTLELRIIRAKDELDYCPPQVDELDDGQCYIIDPAEVIEKIRYK